jgi:hypothetical protein
MNYALILPTGHGKTTISALRPNIIDAGDVLGKRETLRILRVIARQTGDWTVLDTTWAGYIRDFSLITPGPLLFLLPARSIAEEAGLKVLGTAVVPLNTLIGGTRLRGETLTQRAVHDRLDAINASSGDLIRMSTYEDMQELVLMISRVIGSS